MKIIEAMKAIKRNEKKIVDIQAKIQKNAAHTNFDSSEYGKEVKEKVTGWVQACTDLTQVNVELLCSIQRTNLQTMVDIELGGKFVRKTIAAWVWRRRKYAQTDAITWAALNSRDLNEGYITITKDSDPVLIEIIRNYDPSERDEKVSMFSEEASIIDATLEVVNATTDLTEEKT